MHNNSKLPSSLLGIDIRSRCFRGEQRRTQLPAVCAKWIVLIAVLIFCPWSAERAGATVIYSTDFSHPVFDNNAAFAGQDGWSVVGVSGAVVSGPSLLTLGPAQWVEVRAFQAGAVQTGPWRNTPFDTATNVEKTVEMSARINIALQGTSTVWQFAGLTPNLGAFIGGFNVLTDGRLQIITAGFPTTAPIISRDTTYLYNVRFDFAAQKFDVLVNGSPVAANQPFFTSQTVFGAGLFDTFGSAAAGDYAFFDDYSVIAVPEPGSFTLLILGMLAVALASTNCIEGIARSAWRSLELRRPKHRLGFDRRSSQ